MTTIEIGKENRTLVRSGDITVETDEITITISGWA